MTKKKDHTPFALKVIRWYFPKLERISRSAAANFLMKAFFKPLRYQTPVKEKAAEGLARKERHRITEKEIQFFVWGNNDAPYVLLVHGWAGRATQFRKFITPFTSAGYRLIGFDGPAHGQSEGSATNILEFESVLKFCIEKWGSPQAIMAHSFGGGASLYAIANGLPVKKQINIASPVLADEIIKTYLRALNGSWSTGLLFKEKLKQRYDRTFEEFTSETTGKRLPSDVKILLIHDEDDREVEMVHPKYFEKIVSKAQAYYTKGLGHNRILKDDEVIRRCLEFVSQTDV